MSIVRFHGNLSSRKPSRFVPTHGRTDGWAGITKLLDDLSVYTNVPNNKNVLKLTAFS
jgi:hypothetical protein